MHGQFGTEPAPDEKNDEQQEGVFQVGIALPVIIYKSQQADGRQHDAQADALCLVLGKSQEEYKGGYNDDPPADSHASADKTGQESHYGKDYQGIKTHLQRLKSQGSWKSRRSWAG